MIKVEIFRKQGYISGFRISGHAGYAEEGEDIVCSAVSVLAVNTVNSIELFTDAGFSADADNKNGGYLYFNLETDNSDEASHDAQLLLKTLVNGLNDIKNEYSCYIKINDEEVQ